MPLQSTILRGNTRLEQAVSGGPAVKRSPPPDDIDAVRRIQKALVALGVSTLPMSFPNGPTQEPDGKFGDEIFGAVINFQKRVFPTSLMEWDGRAGKKTLEKMDDLLPKDAAQPTPLKTFIISMMYACSAGSLMETWSRSMATHRCSGSSPAPLLAVWRIPAT